MNQHCLNSKSYLLPFVILVFMMVAGCSSKKGTMTFGDEIPAEKINISEICYIQFYVINSQAKVYLNDELYFDSGYFLHGAESERAVSLSDNLRPGNNTIRVELINGEGLASDSYDHYWEIYYELFLNGEPIGYVNEIKENGGTGLVWSKTHEISI